MWSKDYALARLCESNLFLIGPCWPDFSVITKEQNTQVEQIEQNLL